MLYIRIVYVSPAAVRVGSTEQKRTSQRFIVGQLLARDGPRRAWLGEKPQREVFTGHQICEVLIFFAESNSHELRSENTLNTVESESSVLCAQLNQTWRLFSLVQIRKTSNVCGNDFSDLQTY